MTDRYQGIRKALASIKTLARYEPDTVYIGTGEYVAECVRADDGDYYLAADVDAVIEALRAEVERLRGLVVSRFDLDGPPTFRQGTPENELEDPVTAEHCAWFVAEIKRLRAERDALEAEIERLEEALALLPDEHDMIEHNPDEGPRMFCCWQEVKLRGLHDYLITHDKGCWYAQMRALREQEDGND